MHHRSHDQGSLFGVSLSGGLCLGVFVQGVSAWEVSVQRGSLSRGSLSGGVSVQGAGGLCPGVGGLCPGVGGLCPGGSLSGGSLLGRPPHTENPPYSNDRAVRILLECILVKSSLMRVFDL